jgi:predicted RNA-binding Zn-ribbon protein involved in translation (DUF1610 family)
MPRTTIRHLMLVVLYVALFLGLTMPVLRTPPNQRGLLVPATALGAPFLMALVSAFALRPGPHRDRLTTLFVVIALALLAVLLAAFICTGSFEAIYPGNPRVSVVLLVILLLLAICSWFLAVALALEYLIPRRCPRCGKTTLMQSGLFANRTFAAWKRRTRRTMLEWLVHEDTQRFSCFICTSCRREVLLDHCQARLGCPACGHPTLHHLHRSRYGASLPSVIRYRFFWCFSCGGRCKQLLPGIWEETSSPADDREFWL